MKVLQINATVNSGSTGRIAENIGEVLLNNGHESFIAFGRTGQPSKSKIVKIGSRFDQYIHVAKTRLFDRHGFGSKKATEQFIKELDRVQPDVIGIHNLHGYYIHIESIFNYIKSKDIALVWTFHDCWPFTGHCAHFDRVGCENWKSECNNCPLKKSYPASILLDQSHKNFIDKKRIFNGVSKLRIISPSQWLKNLVGMSFLRTYPVDVINNGIDLTVFKPLVITVTKKIVLAVASVWTKSKGLSDLEELRTMLSNDIHIVVIGLTKKQIRKLPKDIHGIERTESLTELVNWYNKAAVFINPTYVDNFPTTNLEALACGTPVVTYNTGGSPESIDEKTGIVVPKGDVNQMAIAINKVIDSGKEAWSRHCRKRAEELYDHKDRYMDYLRLYEEILQSK